MNKVISSIPPSASLSITSKAKAMSAAGKKIYSFAAGEPDFDTPEHIKAAAAKALAAGETKYAPVAGLLALRKAISEKLKNENGLEYSADQIVLSNGAKHSLFNIFMAICNPGDEVIIPAPYWLSYPEMVKIAGGKPVFVECKEENGFKMAAAELEAAFTDRTRALVLNSPSNPIGVVYTEAELRELAEVALRHNAYIVSDEIYEKMVYEDARMASPGSFSEDLQKLTITVNGFSKAFSMTGWRLGYFAGPMDVVKTASSLQSHSTSGPNTFAQYGALAALTGGDDCVKQMVAAFSERRSYLYDRLCSMSGLTCVKPMGAFYMLPNISSFGLDSVKFAERLLEEQQVAVVPGEAFGCDANIRISYACSMENIEQGMDRLEQFVSAL